jgi:hypothetical protein
MAAPSDSLMQDISLAVEMIANAGDSRRLSRAVLDAQRRDGLVDVTGALVMVAAALAEQLAEFEGRTSLSLLDDVRVELMHTLNSDFVARVSRDGQ